MRPCFRSDSWYLVALFVTLISLGSILLVLPISQAGNELDTQPVSYVDALFMATSAVCVTGLATVDMARFSMFGQVVILLLIQLGGLGIISFTSLLLILPGGRIPFRRISTIRSFYVDGVEYDPRKIIFTIVGTTLCIEALGAGVLAVLFKQAGLQNYMYNGIFHAVSAFCNAGFSLFPDSLEGFAHNPMVLLVIILLIILGGLGFIVLQDMYQRLTRKRRYLNYHSRVVLGMTAVLIVLGFFVYFFFEEKNSFSGFPLKDRIMNVLFQSVTPRTAGFDTVPQYLLSQPSKVFTILLMFIGAGPGSIAGGIKVSTIFIIIILMIRHPDPAGDIHIGKHRITGYTLNRATVYFLKGLILLLTGAFMLSLIEGPRGVAFDIIVFEVVSAFGTVGLSLGLTPELSVAGKLVIIGIMFAGRIGLVALSFSLVRVKKYDITYPEGSVLLG
uniref:Trk family potassium uptake protein n=1 Tax=Gracilinema caldarium TaxID=215591 RepID=A0A7C3IF89_9SPIR